MTEHTIKRFEDELTHLKEQVLSMGGLVEKAIRRAVRSLSEHDAKRARKVIERDKAINALEVEIDNMTRSMLALRQPAAGDLRLIIATIKIVTDLERIGDLAEGMAESSLQAMEHPINHYLDSLLALAERSIAQLQDALDAFAHNDVGKALAVIENDEKINRAFRSLQRENLTYMMEDPRQISAGLLATSIAKSIERIGDHAVNIAEMVIYIVKGHDVRHVDHETAAALVSGELDED
ncbi:MAG: phosphate transport system regulatory protein PhoU [Zetaproteobacteria bacterium]|nr:MAG: phosphate transport system regulatory protein PhoU [Zetaproteobacteria bacterium]